MNSNVEPIGGLTAHSDDEIEELIQRSCPDFCELTAHENMHTAESPVIIHSTGDHKVHGVLIQISTATDHQGEEVEDSALSVFIDQREFSLKEAWEIGNAIVASVSQAELADKHLRKCLQENGPSTSVRVARIFRDENQTKHDRLRAARGEVAS
jgi:hypothetical protein